MLCEIECIGSGDVFMVVLFYVLVFEYDDLIGLVIVVGVFKFSELGDWLIVSFDEIEKVCVGCMMGIVC